MGLSKIMISNSNKIQCAIFGAYGYSGQELLRSLLLHPNIDKVFIVQNQRTESVQSFLPENNLNLEKIISLCHEDFKTRINQFTLDLLFLATPAEVSLELVPELFNLFQNKIKIIDLSGVFRLHNPELYPQWYKLNHTKNSLPFLNSKTYGLIPFANVNELQTSALISNPGCYATAILLALIPILKNKIIDPTTIVIDAKSGTSGAGRKAAENLLFNEVDHECLPYKIASHQHFPEICEYANKFSNCEIDPIFSTSLLPTRRGIIAGIYGKINSEHFTNNQIVNNQNIEMLIKEAYISGFKDYKLVKFGPASDHQSTVRLSLKKVVGSARTHITYKVDKTKIYIYSTIDNLMKGAATQAIENMNQIFGWDIELGLMQREGVL